MWNTMLKSIKKYYPFDNGENGHIYSKDIDQTDDGNSTLADRNNNNETEKIINDTTHKSVLLEKYLDQYAFVWWSSVGLFALSIFMWLKLNKKIKNKQSEIVSQ